LANGHQLTLVVRPGRRPPKALEAGCAIESFDLDDQPAWQRVLADVDVVIYCAGSVRGRTPADFELANVTGVDRLIGAMRDTNRPCRLVLISSLAATRPHLSSYAASKSRGEQVLLSAPELDWVILRPPAVYGPGDREMRPLLSWIRRGVAVIVGPATQKLSLLYVGDLVTAILAVMKAHDDSRHQIYEPDDGFPQGYGWDDIIEAVGGRRVVRVLVPRWLFSALAHGNATLARVFGYRPMLTPGKVAELSEPAWLCNNRPLREKTSWKPEVDLAEGVRLTFADRTSS
jgi:nucleoside-diphosphate-sugar epimerase